MHKLLLILPIAGLTGCSALQGMQEDAAFFLKAAAESGAVEDVVTAVANPSVLTATNAIAGLITVIAGGTGAVWGHHRGRNGNGK